MSLSCSSFCAANTHQRRALSKSFFPEQLRKLAEAGECMSCVRLGKTSLLKISTKSLGISACVTSPQVNPRANHSPCLACCPVGHSRLLCIPASCSHPNPSISASSLHFFQLKATVITTAFQFCLPTHLFSSSKQRPSRSSKTAAIGGRFISRS